MSYKHVLKLDDDDETEIDYVVMLRKRLQPLAAVLSLGSELTTMLVVLAFHFHKDIFPDF
jgi:hypothetical protein